MATLLPAILLTVLLAPVVYSLQNPRRSLGYTYKTSNASKEDIVTLTAYLDFTCDDSKEAYPTLLQVADQLSNRNFELVVRSFSLPYHRNSHMITEAVHLIGHYNDQQVYPFLSEIYDNLNSLTTYATLAKTDAQVLDIVANIGARATHIPISKFQTELANYDGASRLDFKYGCTRGVYETPTFMLNDVVVEGARDDWSKEQWMTAIAHLL